MGYLPKRLMASATASGSPILTGCGTPSIPGAQCPKLSSSVCLQIWCLPSARGLSTWWILYCCLEFSAVSTIFPAISCYFFEPLHFFTWSFTKPQFVRVPERNPPKTPLVGHQMFRIPFWSQNINFQKKKNHPTHLYLIFFSNPELRCWVDRSFSNFEVTHYSTIFFAIFGGFLNCNSPLCLIAVSPPTVCCFGLDQAPIAHMAAYGWLQILIIKNEAMRNLVKSLHL